MRPAGKRASRRRVLLLLLFFFLGGSFALSFSSVLALRVGEPGVLLRVSPGDLFTLRYTHSMYGVEVDERFRVDPGAFTLIHVKTSPAALEYFGIESAEMGNVRRTLDRFSVPTASTGDHRLLLNDRVLKLHALSGGHDSVPVRLETLSLFQYLFHAFREVIHGV